MNNDLVAIDTEYKGYKFRSRLEARWAIFFDAIGWEWSYEIEGFKLPSGNYLPDFYFPDLDIWAEVKAKQLTEQEYNLCKELSVASNKVEQAIDVILLEGIPHWKSYRAISNGNQDIECIFIPKHHKYYPFYYSSTFDEDYFQDTYSACIKAKSARFEFGAKN